MYNYHIQKDRLFSDDGQKMFLKIRDHISSLYKLAGAFTTGRAISCANGDSWDMLACIDRLEELGEIKKIYGQGATQDWVYVKIA